MTLRVVRWARERLSSAWPGPTTYAPEPVTWTPRPTSEELVRLAVYGEGPIKVYLEPEGNEVTVPEGDWLVISFPEPQRGAIEIVHAPEGIVVMRSSGDYPTVKRKDGTEVPW